MALPVRAVLVEHRKCYLRAESGEQPTAIITAREDHVNSTRLASEGSGFSCEILHDNRRHCQCRNQSSSRDLKEAEKRTPELTHTLSAHCVLYCERTRRVQLCRLSALLALDRVGRTSAQCALDVCVSSSVHFHTFLVDLGCCFDFCTGSGS
jgi:hypothetical protein